MAARDGDLDEEFAGTLVLFQHLLDLRKNTGAVTHGVKLDYDAGWEFGERFGDGDDIVDKDRRRFSLAVDFAFDEDDRIRLHRVRVPLLDVGVTLGEAH